MYVGQTPMLYVLNLFSAVLQLYLNETGRKSFECQSIYQKNINLAEYTTEFQKY